MHIVMVGTDHHLAGVEVRERLALSGPALITALRELAALPYIAEVAILSTCNRTEVYAIPAQGEGHGSATAPDSGACSQAIAAYLASAGGLAAEEAAGILVTRQDRAALTHLCEVAGGLQSMVVAEAQVAAQVRFALQMALQEETAGSDLNAVFSAALRCGKRIRAETTLGQADTSIAHVVVSMVRQAWPDLSRCRVLLLGAGKINTVAAEVLRHAGASQITVSSRTLAAASDLAAAVGGTARPLEELSDALAVADVLLAATRSPLPLITAALIGSARPPGSAPLLIADMAVPRNVAPEVGMLPEVRLWDVDSLRHADGASNAVAVELVRARQIVEEVTGEIMVWARTREAAPVLAALRAHVDRSKDTELARTLAALDHLSAEDQEAVNLLAHRLVNKMFHHLAARMRQAAADPRMEGYLPVARYLFGIDAHSTSDPADHASNNQASLAGSQG